MLSTFRSCCIKNCFFQGKIVEDGSVGKGAYYAKPVWTYMVEGEKRLLQIVFWPLLWCCGMSMSYTDI